MPNTQRPPKADVITQGELAAVLATYILLTSEEFLTLRDQLVELRGITVSEEAATNAN